MFTGLVEEVGTIAALTRAFPAARLTIRATRVTADMKPGDSIAVDGVCLTVVACDAAGFSVEIQDETVQRTRVTRYQAGQRVNLERALTPHSRMGGHYVQGHVDGVGVVHAWHQEGPDWVLRVSVPPALGKYIVEKGFITMNGISVTVTECRRDVAVHVIPHTRAVTTLAETRVGDLVNLEVDVLAKYVESLLKR
jgi:riboflavin synthase